MIVKKLQSGAETLRRWGSRQARKEWRLLECPQSVQIRLSKVYVLDYIVGIPSYSA
jgi:hypothetical protein